MFTLLTDIGKITLYEGTILQRDGQSKRVLLQSAYRYDERMAWCPSWKLPENAQVDNDGYLQVWYLDDGE
jgi:lysine 2,3-aminomutase